MSVGRWVGRSVCNNFDYKLRLKLNLLRQFGKSLPLSRSITREHPNLSSSNMVHASILDSRGTLLILGSVGQGHQGKICQNRFRSITWESIDLPSSNFHTSILGSKKNKYWFWGHLIKGRGHRCQMCQYRFRSITQERLDLSSSNYIYPHIHPG